MEVTESLARALRLSWAERNPVRMLGTGDT